MDQVGNGNFVADEESKTRIILEGNPQLVAQLEAKLEEYRQRESRWGDTSFSHPEYKALQLRENMFKGDVLAYVLTTAAERDTAAEPIELTETAEAFEERFGYDLTAVKEAPIIYDGRFGVYCHDQDGLFEQGGPINLAFSNAYWIIRSYATNESRGSISGGTGLPDVEAKAL